MKLPSISRRIQNEWFEKQDIIFFELRETILLLGYTIEPVEGTVKLNMHNEMYIELN